MYPKPSNTDVINSKTCIHITMYQHCSEDNANNTWTLPDFIRDPTSSTDCFTRLLKTYLFMHYYCIQHIRGYALCDYALYKSMHSLTWACIHKTHPLHSHYTGKLLLASILVNICRILLDKVLLTTCPWRQHLTHSDWEEKHRSSPQMSFLHHHHSVKLSPHCLVLWARAM